MSTGANFQAIISCLQVLNTYCHNSKTVGHSEAKVYILAKFFALACQKHQDHFHRCYKSKLRGSKVRNLSCRMCFSLKHDSSTSFDEKIFSNLMWCIFSSVEFDSNVKLL